MKKSITGVVALLAGAFAAHSQGTVSFADYLVLPTYITVTLNGNPVGGSSTTTTGNPVTDIANGSDWSVELYANTATGDALSTLTPATVDGSPGTPATATLAGGGSGIALGTWFSTTIADVPGQPTVGGSPGATVAVAAWYNNGGTITSEAAAVAANLPGGFSATGNVASTGGPQTSGPPATAPSLPALGTIALTYTGSVIPEPSTVALGVMGASAFLMRLRKKS
jgi:hypothetical protein